MTRRGRIFVGVCVVIGLWLRLRGLSAEGFADDEVHKWLAANRYLHGAFSGDDAEHPMLMKWLIAAAIALLPKSWAPEPLTRLPNVLVGAASVWLTFLLGKRLFGKTAAYVACALAAVSPTFIGYQRVAKEDTLVGAFMLLMLWCIAERRETSAALSLAGALASKYYVFLPILPLALQKRIKLSRWALAAPVFFAVNWTPLMPETWAYLRDHLRGLHVSTPSLYFMGHIYANLPLHLLDGLPPWFFLVFAVAKVTPVVLALAVAGIVIAIRRRTREERIALAWLGFWLGVWMFSGGKYARYFLPALPALFIFAGHAVGSMHLWLERRMPWQLRHELAPMLAAPLLLGAIAVAGEAHAAARLGPHYRLYVSPLAGGENNLDWLFPHCDYFDAGFREAVRAVNARAEPGAELASEIELPASFYARPDLKIVHRCSDAPCYVITQPGRIYADNVQLLESLRELPPWHVERVAGHVAATVYRIEGASIARFAKW